MKGDETMARKRKPAAKPDEGMDVQSGQEPGPSPAERKAEVEAKFAEADAKADPAKPTDEEAAAAEAEEIRVGRQVRGF